MSEKDCPNPRCADGIEDTGGFDPQGNPILTGCTWAGHWYKPTEADQLADLANHLAMLEYKVRELELNPANDYVRDRADRIRSACHDWREDINARLRKLNK